MALSPKLSNPSVSEGMGGRASCKASAGPVSVFAEYQHFWWADATFSTPAASPAFHHTVRRGRNVSPPPAARAAC